MRSGRYLPAAALAVVLTGCSSTSAPTADPTPSQATTVPSPTSTTRSCADLLILGLRGQGQSLHGHHGLGEEVDRTSSALVSRWSGSVTVRAVRFPSGSDATYDADVSAGVRMVSRARDRSEQRCPSTRVALVGYSQGAEVAHRAAARRPYDLLVLLGDPLRDPGVAVATDSLGETLSGRGNGGSGPAFADPAAVLEVCVRADDVCNAPLTGRVGPPSAAHHTAYESRTMADRVASEVAAGLG